MSAEETIPQLRERIDRQNKEIAGLRKQNGELRTVAASAAFQSEGYAPETGALFVGAKGDDFVVPTAEVVNQFAEQYNLGKLSPAATTEESGEAETEEVEEQDQSQGDSKRSLDPLSRSGSASSAGAGGAATEKMTRAEWIKLSQTDKAAAETALRQGRVQLSGDQAVVPGTNPYDQ